jgi:hypothetical protein
MSPELTWIVIITAVVLVAVVWYVMSTRRSERLRERFGPEYERTARNMGDVRKAEAALEARERRVRGLKIRPLTADDSARYNSEWRDIQRRFVDDPVGATAQADRLVGEVMLARGYPVVDFEQRVEDISVDHPHVVTHYRAARDLVRRHNRGEATTEDLRQAFVHFRALFVDMLEIKTEAEAPPRKANPAEQHANDERELARGRR